MDNFAPDDVYKALLVFLAICAAIITVGKALDVINGWRKPSLDTEKSIADKLSADKQTLDRHEKDIAGLQQGQSLMLQGITALLDHAIHNGNTDQMEKAAHDITTYLINR